MDAIKTLSDAYIYTQETEYAVRTLILLDRLADLVEYDYNEQGWLYERIGTCAAICPIESTPLSKPMIWLWLTTRWWRFFSKNPSYANIYPKSKDYRGGEQKRNPYDIKRNIDERILKDIVNNQDKILSNAPYTELAVMACLGVLNWENNREYLENTIADIIKENTKYDGMTGESGLAGYATMGKSAIAKMCNLFTLADPDFIEKYNRVRSCTTLIDSISICAA